MKIYEGMLVKDALFYLEVEYSVSCFGQTKRQVDQIHLPLIDKKKRSKRTGQIIKIDEKTRFESLVNCFSANPSAPIKFVNEFVGVRPISWNIGQFLLYKRERSKTPEKTKMTVLISLIETATNFSDIDWIIRFSQKNDFPIDEMTEQKLMTAINNQSLILSSEQKKDLFSQINRNLRA